MGRIAGQQVLVGQSDGEFNRIDGTEVIRLSPYNVQAYPEVYSFFHVNGDVEEKLSGYAVVTLLDKEGKQKAVYYAEARDTSFSYMHPVDDFGEIMAIEVALYGKVTPYGGAWTDKDRKFLKGIPSGMQVDFTRLSPPDGAYYLVITAKESAPYGTLKRCKDGKEEIVALTDANTLKGNQIYRAGKLQTVEGYCSLYVEVNGYTAFDISGWIKPMAEGLLVKKKVCFLREQPTPFPRLEAWGKDLVFKNGELLIQNDKVFQWNSPVSGNSAVAPSEDVKAESSHWKEYEQYPLLSTWVLFAKFALLGGAVMAEKREDNDPSKFVYAKMYSQQGQDGTVDYKKFLPELDVDHSNQKWRPMACIDWKTGKSWFVNTTISGTVTANYLTANEGGVIGPFMISPAGLVTDRGGNGKPYLEYLGMDASGIRFENADRDVSIALGNKAVAPESGLGCNMFLSNMKGGNIGETGVLIDMSGKPMAGFQNVALWTKGGCIKNLCFYVREVTTSQTLGTGDTVIIVNGKNVTLKLPVNDEVPIGKLYCIFNVTVDITVKISTGSYTSNLNAGQWMFAVYTHTFGWVASIN